MKINRRDFLIQNGLSSLAIPFVLKVKNDGNEEDSWIKIREKFTLNKNRIYFNNGTFGPSPKVVQDTVISNLEKCNFTGEYGHTDDSRKVLAEFVGVTTEEISLTHNTTEGINIVCWGIPLKAGDEVIISLHEHVGNAVPWLNRAKLHDIKLRTFEPGKDANETLEIIKKLITPKTRVIAVPHITCTTGQVLPIKEISALAANHNIFTAIDGAHGPGSLNLDLKDLGCDFYASSCHKWMLGPNGTGFVYIKKELIDTLQAIQVGAYSDNGWDLYSNPPKLEGYNPTAHRFDYGSQSMPLYAGAAASAQFHNEIGKAKVEERIRELNSHLFEGLTNMRTHLDILTPKEPQSRIGILTFKPKNHEYKAFANKISSEGFRIRVVPESKLDAIRISTHIYNSKAEIDSLLLALEKYV